jgi:uncharacterized protein YkuJ
MVKVAVYYEEHPETLEVVPMKMVVYFGRGKIKWDKNYFYLALTTPFNRQRVEDFDADMMSITITQGEMVRNPEKEAQIGPCFGIYLPYLIERLEKMKADRVNELEQQGYYVNPEEVEKDDYTSAEQFIIQMVDVEEVMQMEDLDRFFKWN